MNPDPRAAVLEVSPEGGVLREELVRVWTFPALWEPRGFVRFINMRPDRKEHAWACDACRQPVPPSRMARHRCLH